MRCLDDLPSERRCSGSFQPLNVSPDVVVPVKGSDRTSCAGAAACTMWQLKSAPAAPKNAPAAPKNAPASPKAGAPAAKADDRKADESKSPRKRPRSPCVSFLL